MHCRIVFVLSLAAIAIWSSAAGAATRATAEGRVVDASGNPVTDVQVSRSWNWSGGKPTAMRDIAVDENGRFEFETGEQGRPQLLIAYADDGDLAGAVEVAGPQESGVVITLKPSVQVRGRFVCSDLGGDPGSVTGYWRYEGRQVVVAEQKDGVFEFKAPPGTWSYFIYGRDIKSTRGEITLQRDKPVHDMGEMDLPGAFITMNRGLKVDDWTVTDARGVPIEAAQVKDYKGKWLLVEFWGHW